MPDDDNVNLLVAKLFGAVLVLVGILGFFVGTGTLIIFGVNPLHNVVHLASGAVLLGAAYALEGRNASTANTGLGAVYVLVAVLGFAGVLVPGLLNTHADLIPHADNVLHLLVALVLLATGLGVLSTSRQASPSR